MTTIVFLHGGGMGGWVWDEIATTLRSEGHKVLTPTFTGFGERSHLIGRDVTHDVHVTDIVNVLTFEDVRDSVLVAYSYGGSVAPGVVARAGDRIDRVVYLDGIVPESGKSVSAAMGYMTPEEAAGLDALLASGDGPIGTGVDEMLRNEVKEKPYKMSAEKQAWLLARMSDMPLRGMVSPVTHGGNAIDKPVDYLGIVDDVMVPQHERARGLGWSVQTIGPEVDHAFIVGAPERVLDFLRPRL
ncbi:MAG: alpha/beta hydrolase [Rhodospirillales bacterium]|nr:alpha/beta hydrolase [Rhodospirillales bacterium]